MPKAVTVALYASATMFFSAASMMAAPSLAEAGLPMPAVQTDAGTLPTDISVMMLDSQTGEQAAIGKTEDALAPTPNDDSGKASSLTDLVRQLSTTETADREQECLAGAVYFESKGEPLEGQHAVAEVIINRAKSGRFPGSLCSVVFQRGQFSFVRGNAMPPIPRHTAAWREAATIARIAIEDRWKDVVPKALFFHARRVSPNWKMQRIASVGNHIFYR